MLGLYDADGMVTVDSLRICFANESLINETQALMSLIGFPTKKRRIKEHQNTYCLDISKNVAKNFVTRLTKFYTDSRREVFSDSVNPSFKTLNSLNYIESTKFSFDEDLSDIYVYNLSVEEDESYVVNNIITHNCFVGTKPSNDQDSIDGIYETLSSQAKTLKSEGGWGMNFSFIRPRGSFIKGIGSETPGAVKFMELFDKSSELVTEGSGISSGKKKGKEKIRKGAMMRRVRVLAP